MKKIAVLLIVLCLAFSLTACTNSTPVQNKLERNWLVDLPANSYSLAERLTYDVISANGVNGVMTQTYQKVTSATVGVREFTNINAYLLETELTCGSDIIEETLLFSAGSADDGQIYPPIASYAMKFIDDAYYTEFVLYNGNEVEYYTSDTDGIPADAEKHTASLGSPYYDNQQIYTVIRAAGLDSKTSITMTIPLAAEHQTAQIACNFVTNASVTSRITEGSALKAFDCTQVSLSRSQRITGSPSYAFFSGEFTLDGHTYRNVPVKIVEGSENADGTVTRGSVFILKNLETFTA